MRGGTSEVAQRTLQGEHVFLYVRLGSKIFSIYVL